jgi:hypothetical protein
MISVMMTDFQVFYTDYKKLSFEFLAFKDSFPLRMEAISFINLIIKKRDSDDKTNRLIYDEVVKNIKKYRLINHELSVIKNFIKGNKIHSVFLIFGVIFNSGNSDLLEIIVKYSLIFRSKKT